MPKISVIIPVYNTEKYLPQCLDSVLAQTFNDIEVICVNDGSSDNSGKILAEYAEKDMRIKIIGQKNQGASGARNAGLDVAKGDWICFTDSDDLLPPNALAVLYEIALASKCKIVASRERFKNDEYSRIKEKINFDCPISYLLWNGLRDFVRDSKIYSSPCNKLYAKELFRTQRFKVGMVFEDWPVITILFGLVKQYATTDIKCYIYREDNQSTTRSVFSIKKVKSYIQGIRMVYQAYKNTTDMIYARMRIAVAVKMLVNKVYHAKDCTLVPCLLQEVQKLFDENILSNKKLPLKTRWRLWRLKHQTT